MKSIPKIKANLTLIGFKEGKTFLIYSPALDLTGYGSNEEEARQSFHIMFEGFIDYATKKGTLKNELNRLGWQIKGGAKHPKFTQPNFAELLLNNKDLYSLIDKKDYKKFNNQVEIPA